MKFETLPNGKSEGFAIVRSVEIKKDKNGNDYLITNLGDKEGAIQAKMWKYADAPYHDFKVGDFVKVRGVKDIWNGDEQFKIEQMRLVNENDSINYEDYIQSACLPGEIMISEIEQVVATFRDEDFKKLTTALLNKYRDKLIYWPGAKVLHHSVRGGLLMHTLSMLRMADAVSKIYTFVNYDLLCSGVILHDISKIEEISSNTLGLAGDYSAKGNLLGHLVMGAIEIDRMGRELNIDENKLVLLEHMLISHHGQPEFGAAKYPGFVEAQILSSLDDMDAKIYELNELMNKVNPGEDVRTGGTLDYRTVYNHGMLNETGVELM